jgi:hypothetical protein
VIRVQIDPKLQSWWDAMKLGVLSFLTYRLHPLAPYWRTAIIRRAELRNPSRPNGRLS